MPAVKTTEIIRVKLTKRHGNQGDAQPPLSNQISKQCCLSPLLPKMCHRLFFPDATAPSVNLIEKCLDPGAAAAFVEFHNHVLTLVTLNYSKKSPEIFLKHNFIATEALQCGHGEIMIQYFAPFEVQIHRVMLTHKNYPQF